jgi:hypothetical protein
MAHHHNSELGRWALVFSILLLASSLLLISIASIAEQGRGDWSLFFLSLFGIVGFIGVVGVICEKGWGKHYSVAFGFCVLFLVFPIGNLSAGVRLLAFIAGIVIVIWSLNSTSAEIRERAADADNAHRDGQIGKRLRIANMSEASENIEGLKYNLEREKFLWEVATHRQENNFFNRNFGVIITAIVSFAAVAVSYLQLTISLNNARAQIDNESLKNDRQFYLEMAKFLLDRRQELTTRDNEKALYLRGVVVAAFPTDAAIQISTNMRDMANTNDIRKIWGDALKMLQARGPRPGSRLAPR